VEKSDGSRSRREGFAKKQIREKPSDRAWSKDDLHYQRAGRVEVSTAQRGTKKEKSERKVDRGSGKAPVSSKPPIAPGLEDGDFQEPREDNQNGLDLFSTKILVSPRRPNPSRRRKGKAKVQFLLR